MMKVLIVEIRADQGRAAPDMVAATTADSRYVPASLGWLPSYAYSASKTLYLRRQYETQWALPAQQDLSLCLQTRSVSCAACATYDMQATQKQA